MIDPYKKITTDTECLKKRCLCTPVIVGPTGPQGPTGPADQPLLVWALLLLVIQEKVLV